MAVWLVAIVQMRFIHDWMGYVRQHAGTPGTHYGSPLDEQKAVVGAACRFAHKRVLVVNRTNVFDQSLRYVASAEALCAGKEILFCNVDACVKGADTQILQVVYDRPRSGRLAIAVGN